MFSSFLKSWVGDYTKDELKKFSFLAFIFFFTIGIYWFLRTGKDGVFNTIVGFEWQPFAKIVSMFVVIPLATFYGMLVNRFPRHKVFYALGTIYTVGTLLSAYFVHHPTIGIANIESDPLRIFGWIYYIFIESFGSIMVPLFWSFSADTTAPEVAKRWFPFLSVMAQFGSLFGCAVNAGYFGKFAITSTLIVCAIAVMMIPLLIYLFMRVIPKEQLKSYGDKGGKKEEKKTSAWEGLKLVFSQPYLLGVYLSISIFEIMNTLLDYRFKALVGIEVQKLISSNAIDVSQAGEMKTILFNQWVGSQGVWMSVLAIVAYFFGLGNIGRKLGFTKSLLLLPTLLGFVSVAVYVVPSLWFAFLAVVIVKGMNYVFYQPTKEQLYIPTSKDAKYKSKAFLEMFGSRSSKAAGSLINMAKLYFPKAFPAISLVSSLALCGSWIMVSRYLGKTYEKATAKGDVVC
jgi:AAA family ATP:ADP antiporter